MRYPRDVEPSWDTIDHTGDVGLDLRAPALPALFATAAGAMYSLCLEPDRIRAAREDRLELEAESLEDLFFEWLREIHGRMVADGVVYAAFEFDRLEPTGLSARLRGEPLDVRRHGAFTELKAVTRHDLSVEQVPGGWSARVIFDV